jgi:hypothetical protein
MLKGAGGPAGLWSGIAQVPERQVDIVDRTVNENPAVAGGVSHKKPSVVPEVASVGADDERTTDSMIVEDLGSRVAV